MAARVIFNPEGFCNIKDQDGKVNGYSFQFKAQYYRGFTLSILHDLQVKVDGVAAAREDICLRLHGETFTMDEITTVIDSDYRWEFGEYLTVLVRKEGGLSAGKHHIWALQHIAPSYMPFPVISEMETDFEIGEDGKAVGSREAENIAEPVTICDAAKADVKAPADPNPIKRSVSLYSYQDEYYDGTLDLEGCLCETAKTGATGVELLAEQMIKTFPNPIEDEAFRAHWFELLDKYGLTPSCYDAFLENRIFRNRTCSVGEQVNMMKRDLRLAKLLGFPVIRTLVSTPMPVIEGSLEYAEKIGVKIGLEVHAPFSLNSGWADGYLEMIHRTGTKYFGFIPDMGIFCRNMPDVVRDQARRMGASEECIRIVDACYAERVAKGFTKIKYDLDLGKANMEYRMANGMKEMMDAITAAGGKAADEWYAGQSFTYSWSEPQDIIDNIDVIFHTHAKFYNVHEDLTETAVALPEVIEAYKKAGYVGFLSSEYEGGEHLRDIGVDSITQVARHQEAMRRAIG